MVRDLDTHWPRGYRLSHNIFLKMQTQGFKDYSRFKKSKPKDLKPALSRDNAPEPAKKKNKKDKKKRFHGQRREHTRDWKKQIVSIKVIEANLKKKYSYIIYYNYDKKGHY